MSGPRARVHRKRPAAPMGDLFAGMPRPPVPGQGPATPPGPPAREPSVPGPPVPDILAPEPLAPEILAPEILAKDAVLLPGLALEGEAALLAALDAVVADAPFRHMRTRGGFTMSVAMTSCGDAGWVSDRRGYRYDPTDPDSGRPWPAMPPAFDALARRAAAMAGFGGFAPDSCLVNRYAPGARMALHQDRNERDFGAPIVSVSLGLPAVFLFGGASRTDRPRRVRLRHGDAVVWGGTARLAFHGVAPLPEGEHLRLGRQRINLTFRRAL